MTGSIKRLRCGLIGAGGMGQNHARVYAKIAHLVAVVDLNEQLGKQVAQQYGATYYSDVTTLLAQQELDAVSVVVPTVYHTPVALEVIKHGIPTLVEKPIADTTLAAKRLLTASKRYKTPLMVGHIERFNPAILTLKKIIQSNILGNIVNLLSIRVGIAPPQTPNSDVVLDLGIHDTDVFSFLLDQKPKSANISKHKIFRPNAADAAVITLNYPHTTAVIQTNWLTPVKIRKLFITGLKGFAELDYIEQSLTLYKQRAEMKSFGNFYDFVSLSDLQRNDVYVEKQEPLINELTFFLHHRAEWDTLHRIAEAATDALTILTSAYDNNL